jgi:putative ABC transport system substrate-binding protein
LVNAGVQNRGTHELSFFRASQAEPAGEADAPNSVIQLCELRTGAPLTGNPLGQVDKMTRRSLLRLTCAAALAIAFPARTQQAPKVHKVALVFSTSPIAELTGAQPLHPLARSFVEGMRALGYVEGQNITIERRSAEGQFDRFPDIFRELVADKVDVIVTVSNPLTHAARKVTQTVPIVVTSISSPVEEGFAQSLARPGRNITGLSIDSGPGLDGKRLQLLKELLPKLSRVALLTAIGSSEAEEAKAVASKFGLRLVFARHTPTQYGQAFDLIIRERPDALLVVSSAQNYANRHMIIEFATNNRIPTIYPNREFVDAGGLISYGVEVAELARRAAKYVDLILKGEAPGNLPIQQPTKFELAVNRKTAKSLGLTIPTSLLLQADQIVEGANHAYHHAGRPNKSCRRAPSDAA